MTVLQLSTTQDVFLIIIACSMILFYLAAAALAIAAMVLVSKVKTVIAKAEEAIDSVEAATETIKNIGAQAGGPMAVFKMIKTIIDLTHRRK